MLKKPTVRASAVAAGIVTLAAVPLALTAEASPPGEGAAAPASSCAERESAEMSLEQQVGQLFISGVDADAPTQAELDVIGDLHLGGVILTNGSSAGVEVTRQVSDRAQAAATTTGVPLWVSADQEGGKVQHLKGPGFDSMPTAVEQGKLDPAELRARAKGWGGQLSAAGVNLDLAPVLDTVPEELGSDNKPIGFLERNYGSTPEAVAAHGTAFQAGMTDAGVAPAVKHFSGLGRVLGNTDDSKDVKDDVTTRDDAYLQPFRSAISQGVPMVMISSARYTKIDPDEMATFSSTVLTGMLRDDLGFTGVIVSDDLGAAAAVEDVPPGERALRFLTAGGTVALSVDASKLPEMVGAVLQRARADAEFRARVEADAERVLKAKGKAGLLDCR
ncbi:glycoside hydrolase family 3 N-terminal domain-containing protein [Streptomyces albidus (ex Kaewkla and Franco 2022)]|uniref:glycoside hydrolase family 3 N-terminal domain-containing protein n=1 Tax=Streptomyces albidus (ex Kaewkla and Franco 2022) TaxID=722709 RepID=UPI001F3F913A|nr:glycoside hydrolase family 3 N-terminal domain-containing protein [Streptomyces albidus (ex Kaewkla and Franco 2022)]